ncbi:MAG: hypothetical protein AYK18_18125 [Theionarchaea archaeon DG-70]|nr:MAG: hypothetical protein AYK18_18125 [Theionarchaea archaeon DG-70]
MNRVSVKYIVVWGILLLSLMQESGTSSQQQIEAHLDLIQKENHITVAGLIIPNRDIDGVRIVLDILRYDRSHVYTLLDGTINLQTDSPVALKDLNDGNDITFSLEYLYGKYIVTMRISEGNPPLDTVRLEKDFQTKLVHMKENIPIDISDGVPQSQKNQYYLPCCSSKVAKDLNDYFEFSWTQEQIDLAAEKIENEIYPKYSNGFSDLNGFLSDLNIALELDLKQEQIDELIYALESGSFYEKTDAPIPHISDEIIEQLAKHSSDSSAPFLTGRTVIARIYMNDPNNSWSADDRNMAWQQIITVATHIQNWAPYSANVSLVHVSFISTLEATPDYTADAPDHDWMDHAVYILGYLDTTEFAKAIKTTYNADHVIQLFLPHTDGRSYALPYLTWGYGERACVFFYASCYIVCIRNDEGPYKHEALHLFGACDEYYESQCSSWCNQCDLTYETYRSFYLNEGNCEYCMSNPVPCVMRSGANDNHEMNDFICDYTRGQVGWGDYDEDGILDPFDACPAQPGSDDNYGCPSFGFADIASFFPFDNFHVVGDNAKCTDVLGTANVSWVYGNKHILRPEGKTHVILTSDEHDTGNLVIVGGPAINPVASEFDSYFSIAYNYNPNPPDPIFEVIAEGHIITLHLNDYYTDPKEDICIVYLGRHNYRTVLLIWGYGWEGTYAGSLFMSVPQVWNAYAQEHLLLLRWKDINGNKFIEFSEVHPENVQEVPVTPPTPGTPQLLDPVFKYIPYLFAGFSFHVVGDNAKCTDVLGTANVSWAYGLWGISRPEGKTDAILTVYEHDNGNLIPVGGPAINPVADEFDSYFGIFYDYVPGVSFTISCKNENKSISLDLSNYPSEDICIVYLGRHSNRNILLIWGYGWKGTYAGSLLMSDPYYWSYYGDNHLLLLRWRDLYPYEGYIQSYEISVEVAI